MQGWSKGQRQEGGGEEKAELSRDSHSPLLVPLLPSFRVNGGRSR